MTSLLLLNHNLLMEKDRFITFLTTFGVLGSVISSLCVITYLGPIHRDETTISTDDWRRIYILCFSVLNMIFLTISLLYDFRSYKLLALLSVFVVVYYLHSGEDERLPKQKTHTFVILRAWTDILCISFVILLIFIERKSFIPKVPDE